MYPQFNTNCLFLIFITTQLFIGNSARLERNKNCSNFEGCEEITVCRQKVKLYSDERIQINLNYFRQVNAQKYRWKEAN